MMMCLLGRISWRVVSERLCMQNSWANAWFSFFSLSPLRYVYLSIRCSFCHCSPCCAIRIQTLLRIQKLLECSARISANTIEKWEKLWSRAGRRTDETKIEESTGSFLSWHFKWLYPLRLGNLFGSVSGGIVGACFISCYERVFFHLFTSLCVSSRFM